jgi:FMN phosphatase YigB (HAD superfamily)
MPRQGPVFLVDIDNTLIDNDRFRSDLRDHLERALGAEGRDRYWDIQERLFVDLGYRDYIGALQRCREERPLDIRLLGIGALLMDYPFSELLYPGALDMLKGLQRWGRTVVLSDGDAVFQPRKVESSGISRVVEGRVLIYIHKEEALRDVERRYPSDHYVLVDDKIRILDAAKKFWGPRVTTVLPRQGAFARDPAILGAFGPADLTVESVTDLLHYDLTGLLAASRATSTRSEAET